MSDGLRVSAGGHCGSVGEDVEVGIGEGGVDRAQSAKQGAVVFVGRGDGNGG